MRFLFFTFLAVAVSVSGRAAGQLIEVSARALDGWTVTGTGGNALSSGSRLVLPAGSQLSRQFSDSVVVVHLVAEPVFSDQAEDWPIFGLGSAALAFVRQNGQGHLVLVIDESTAIDLPVAVALDAKGKQDPVDLLLAYDRVTGTGLASIQDQVRVFEVAPSVRPTELWLSAGARSDWPVDQLQVLLPDLDAKATGAGNLPDPASSGPGLGNSAQAALSKLQAALNQLRARSAAASATAETATSVDQTKAPAVVSTLEVFTPPSVRRTRVVSAVRDAVVRSQAK